MLTATDITVAASGKHLLHRVSLELAPGECVALLGENGAGKSTLLKALAGDHAPKSGQVRMNGRPLYLWSMRERARRRAVLPQDAQVAFGFTTLEVVLLGRYPFCGDAPGRNDYDIARAALAHVDALHLESRLVPTLSGGEKCRAQLARVLAQIWEPAGEEPRYLLLDEPTTGLDLAARYAHRLVLMRQGKIVAAGAPQAVLTAERIADCLGINALVMPHPRTDCPLIVAAL